MSHKVFSIGEAAERADELSRLVAEAEGGDQQPILEGFNKSLNEGKVADFVNSALSHQDAVISKASEDEAEGFYLILSSYFRAIESEEALTRVADSITKAATASTESKTTLRLKILVHLYNSLEDSSFSLRAQKLSLIATVISYASNTKQLDQLAPYLASAASWQKEWQLSNAEARGLFLLLSRAYGKAGDGSSAQAFLIRYLQTFEPSVAADGSSAAASPASLEEAKEHAKEAAIGYIRAPALSQRSALAHLAAVRALASDPKYAKLHELLLIFSSGGLEQYEAFYASNASFVASLGVDHNASLRTIRLLSLCSLAAAKGPVIPYAEVAAAIKVPVAEVESWVVQAIAEGLIDAKMDQPASTVTVTRAMQREFGAAQWGSLQSKLRAWRDSVAGLLSMVEGPASSPASAGGAAATAEKK